MDCSEYVKRSSFLHVAAICEGHARVYVICLFFISGPKLSPLFYENLFYAIDAIHAALHP